MFTKWYRVLSVLFFATYLAPTLTAQDAGSEMVHYLSQDSNGVHQVYQLLLDRPSDLRQITHAASDVIAYGTAYDGLSVAYISDGQIWMQPIHTDEPEALATVTAEQFYSSPVFSQDGQYVAYADNGVWLVDLSTRETRQILVDVRTGTHEYRTYQPKVFSGGMSPKLVVDVGLLEWNSEGVYDLATDQLVELDERIPMDTPSMPDGLPLTDMLPLADGQVLVYGGINGEVRLYIAESLDAINAAEAVMHHVSYNNETLFPVQAVEFEAGKVRIFGPTATQSSAFYFDVDVAAGTVSDVQIVTVAASAESKNTILGELSPEGSLVPVYLNGFFSDAGSIYGTVVLRSLDGTPVDESPVFASAAGEISWRR